MNAHVLLRGMIGIAISASLAQSQSAEITETKRDSQKLVIGDWYNVSIERQGIKKEAEGVLVSFTDDWIVLGQLRSSAADIRVAYLSEIPFLGQSFRKRVSYYSKAYHWIPRQAAKIEKRQVVEIEAVKTPFQDDAPKLADTCEVYSVEDAALREFLGDFSEMAGGQIKLTTNGYELVKGPDSRWSRLPIIGGAFSNDTHVARKIEHRFALDKILMVESEVAYVPVEAEISNKRRDD